jgi:uncharacterized protein
MSDTPEHPLVILAPLFAAHDVRAALSAINRFPGIASITDEYGTTALIAACGHSDLPVVERLCALGADVNAHADTGETPLVNVVRAARFGEARSPEACARLLLTQGADPNLRVYDGCSALHQAIIHSQVDLVRLLLEFGADPSVRVDDGPNQEDALQLAQSERPQGDIQDRQAIVDLLLASAGRSGATS